jgi:hypothetical protein
MTRHPRLLLLAALLIHGCTRTADRPDTTRPDSAFDAMQQRGKTVMGVDQYASAHVFEDLPDGGRIVLDHGDSSDTPAIIAIRLHMREVATDFQRGDFTNPFAVHDTIVPGTAAMAGMRDRLAFEVRDRPRGAEVRVVSVDPNAVAAVHAFLAFQRTAHRAAGHDHAMPGHGDSAQGRGRGGGE